MYMCVYVRVCVCVCMPRFQINPPFFTIFEASKMPSNDAFSDVIAHDLDFFKVLDSK